MITFSKLKFAGLSKEIRDAITQFDDQGCTIDESKISAAQLQTLGVFLSQNFSEFKEVP